MSPCFGSIPHIRLMWWIGAGELVVDADGTFKEGPMRILDSQDQVLRHKTVRLVKVLWQHRGVEEAT